MSAGGFGHRVSEEKIREILAAGAAAEAAMMSELSAKHDELSDKKLWATEPSWQHHVAAEINKQLESAPSRLAETFGYPEPTVEQLSDIFASARKQTEALANYVRDDDRQYLPVICGTGTPPSEYVGDKRIKAEQAVDDSWEKNR